MPPIVAVSIVHGWWGHVCHAKNGDIDVTWMFSVHSHRFESHVSLEFEAASGLFAVSLITGRQQHDLSQSAVSQC